MSVIIHPGGKLKPFTLLFALSSVALLIAAHSAVAQNFWQPTIVTVPSGAISASDGTLFYTNGPSAFRSTNNGSSWDSVLTTSGVTTITVKSNTLFVCTQSTGMLRSTNRGTNWSAINSGLTSASPRFAIIAPSGNVFIGSSDAGVFRSTNDGDSWTNTSPGLTDLNISALTVNAAGVLFAGVKGGNGIYRSTNNGGQWTLTSMVQTCRVYSLAVQPGNGYIYAGTQLDPNAPNPNGVYRSTDGGVTWTQSGLLGQSMCNSPATFLPNGTIYIGSSTIGAFRSTNNGATWDSVNTGFTNQRIISLSLANGYLFAGTFSGIFRSALPATSVIEFGGKAIPEKIFLEQNYPNPFNPGTTLRFSLPEASRISLKVFNALGEEVAIVASGEFNTGTYSATFDASSLSSGVYFYRLETATFSTTMKMLLTR